MKYSVILVAAGNGSRMNLGYNKVFYPMEDGMTVLEKSVRLFDQHAQCNQIIIVTQPENFAQCHFDTKTKLICCKGGDSRSMSVTQGLAQVNEEYVMVHDGARPYVTSEQLDRLVACLATEEACLLAVPCKDTIKIVNANKVMSTPDRSTLYQAQTPQAFKTALLKECYKKAALDGRLTDDASCVELYGNQAVAIVEGSYANIKITTQEDLK